MAKKNTTTRQLNNIQFEYNDYIDIMFRGSIFEPREVVILSYENLCEFWYDESIY
jgi:hypothetical protein